MSTFQTMASLEQALFKMQQAGFRVETIKGVIHASLQN